VRRHVTRWAEHAQDQGALAKQAAALLLSFEGSICIYQGEELGQIDTQLEFHELTDPEAINFWPEAPGRDGCRTPMVWEKDAPNGGFSVANKTWLPVKEPQKEHAVSEQGENSVLAFYREMLALRRARADLREGATQFLDLPDPVLGFARGDGTVCVYNLSKAPVTVDLGLALGPLLSQAPPVSGTTVAFAAHGFILGARL